MKQLRVVPVAALLLACKGDAECIVYPCPAPVAAQVTVVAANATGPVAGAQLTVNGQLVQGACASFGAAGATTCQVFGGTGRYDVEVNAPGYTPARATFTVTGSDAGCGTCGELDRQFVTLTLQPTTQAARS